jgi:putative oxidoreductase
MKIIKELPCYFLAIIFLVFGLNGFLNFIPLPAPVGDSTTFFGVLFSTGYLKVVKTIEIICALLLIMPKTRALGLVLLMPIVVNILLFELIVAKTPGLSIALFILTAIGLYFNCDKYASMLPKLN